MSGLNTNTSLRLGAGLHGGTGLLKSDTGLYFPLGANVNQITPDKVASGLLWFTADDIVEVDGKASQLTNLFATGHNATQGVDINRPVITPNSLNGHNKLTFDGNDRLLTDTLEISQPFTVFLVAKPLNLTPANSPIFGSIGAPFSVFQINNNQINYYAGATGIFETTKTDLSAYIIEHNTANSKYYRNGIVKENVNIGVNNITTGVEIGGYANDDLYCGNFDFYEIIYYSGIVSDLNKAGLVAYLTAKYATNFSIERLDNIFNNSVNLFARDEYNVRNAFSEFSFYTSETEIKVSAISTMASGGYVDYAHIAVFENDVFTQIVAYPATITEHTITLSSGYKKITLVEGSQSSSVDGVLQPLGTYISRILVNNFTKINNVGKSDIGFLGDSISQYATIMESQSFTRLFKVENNKNVGALGYGGGELKHFASTPELIATTVVWIQSLFANQTGRKVFVIQVATNDYGVSSTPSVTFTEWYANLMDAIHTADSGIEIYALSPLIRTGETSLLDDYRTVIATVCSNRAWSTHIAGKTILSLDTDFLDGLHPTDAGQKKLKDALYAIIYP